MPVINAAPVIAALSIGPITCLRANPPVQNARGGFDDSPERKVILDPIQIHTLSGRDLLQVPEADRNTETIQIYTLVRLHVADDGLAADRICYNERVYRVIKSYNEDANGGVFIAYASLEEPGAKS